MYNENLFNQNYINELLKQRAQIEQQIKFEMDQEKEIGNMLKALNDYFDAAQKNVYLEYNYFSKHPITS